jgi:hypothetical protein
MRRLPLMKPEYINLKETGTRAMRRRSIDKEEEREECFMVASDFMVVPPG